MGGSGVAWRKDGVSRAELCGRGVDSFDGSITLVLVEGGTAINRVGRSSISSSSSCASMACSGNGVDNWAVGNFSMASSSNSDGSLASAGVSGTAIIEMVSFCSHTFTRNSCMVERAFSTCSVPIALVGRSDGLGASYCSFSDLLTQSGSSCTGRTGGCWAICSRMIGLCFSIGFSSSTAAGTGNGRGGAESEGFFLAANDWGLNGCEATSVPQLLQYRESSFERAAPHCEQSIATRTSPTGRAY